MSYALWIEPFWIEVNRHSVQARVLSPLRIAHLSDLHVRGFGRRELKTLSLLASEKPDAILITGDSIAEDGNYSALREFLQRLKAPLGVWATRGNWEHWRPNENEADFYTSTHVNWLDNAAAPLRQDVWVIGLDDSLAGNPDLKAALSDVPTHVYKIGMIHSPDFFDRMGQSFDLTLAGHTHGGQLRLPFLPPPWLPEGSGRYVWGWYENEAQKMYVNRGLGNSIIDARFLARPEIAVFDLVPVF